MTRQPLKLIFFQVFFVSHGVRGLQYESLAGKPLLLTVPRASDGQQSVPIRACQRSI